MGTSVDYVNTNMLPMDFTNSKNGKYRSFGLGGCSNKAAISVYQMRLLLIVYVMETNEENCTLSELFAYMDFVQKWTVSCRSVKLVMTFCHQNLTENTHYIASTGIEGRHADPKVLVMLDAYAIEGIKPDQIKYLYARTHLNPTYEYGVSFERGTAVDFEDRRQIIISGTASINNHGEIVFPGDVVRQAERMCENVEALLKEADSCFEELQYIIVYLRDTADYLIIKSFFEKKIPNIPTIITLASVCRPGWLVEMECMAVKAL
jgi:enamine deaminase RidA (YjgF/YER057c/UK114 family)